MSYYSDDCSIPTEVVIEQPYNNYVQNSYYNCNDVIDPLIEINNPNPLVYTGYDLPDDNNHVEYGE